MEQLEKEFMDFVLSSFEKKKELFLQKNKQYGATDPLANFRTVARMRYVDKQPYEGMFLAAKDFYNKHVAFVENSSADAVKLDESLGDIAVYAVIMEFLIHKHKQSTARA